jgi:hypothetical protein
MDYLKFKNRNEFDQGQDSRPDSDEVQEVESLLKFFGKAYSAMKIYPPGNPSIQHFFNSFEANMKEFLEEYEKLILSIDEFEFLYKEETVFLDEEKKTSLPFLFFKDGMRELSFHKGLEEKELQDFLMIIKKESELPPEDSDIVNLLWVKDFAHIRCFAIDEFLKSDMGGAEEVDIQVDKEEFSKGKIILAPQDLADLSQRSAALGLSLSAPSEKKDNNIHDPDNIVLPSQLTALSNDESPEIDSMLEECRAVSRMSEMVNLLFEILFLEERPDRFAAILDVLEQCFKEVIYKFNFSQACLILNRTKELKEAVSGEFEEKTNSLEKILQEAKSENSMARLRNLFQKGEIEDFDSFFQYLKLLGSITLPFAGDIWEGTKEPLIRLKASNFLFEMGNKDIDSLVSLARDERASLTKEVISILGRIGERRVLPYLERYISHQDKSIRLETIQALRKINGESANKIILKFLVDEEAEVRTLAAVGLKYYEDSMTLNYIIQLARKKDFQDRNKMEKKTLLRFLALSRRKDVCEFLRSLLKRGRFFAKAKMNETRLCAVSALEVMATPEAVNTLKEGTKIWNKNIRQACRLSLRRIIPSSSSDKILEESHEILGEA